MTPNPINHHAQRLVQPHHTIAQRDLAQQLDRFLHRSLKEGNESLSVEIPRIALGQRPSCSQSNGGVGRIVAREEVNESRVDLRACRRVQVL